MSSSLITQAIERQQAEPHRITRTIIVPCQLRLHLRVAARVVITARQFQSEIEFASGRRRANAKSMFGMLELGAVGGQQLSVVAQGADAERAMQVLTDLFESAQSFCQDEAREEAQ